ncbi:thiol-disulfide oxidoreductase DCC family protein [Flectobacillus roseus]|uniref:Thiol-disulfide oxidoreductase DCC family protein n=1 Tax=Flectobacillus roseus TaxID=502259 RepID=A0ABT6Y505_9BACT|nr:thiol-disulfide oxidoreductase DCC family protein [Flectobacillus roseus]MDI9858648.1 thiol-disulfide oxidoreductase DCC family protein [Flectobacillus roseus]
MKEEALKQYSYDLILFDGVCNFCNSSINFVIDHDSQKRFKFASLQSEVGQQYLAQFSRNKKDFDSVLLVKNGRVFEKSDAALHIARHLDGAWKSLYFLRWVPRVVRDMIYDLVAKNRYRIFGKSDACRLPNPELRERFLA